MTPSTYVGKRRALPVDERAVETVPATPYVGKRRAVATHPEEAPRVVRDRPPTYGHPSHGHPSHGHQPHGHPSQGHPSHGHQPHGYQTHGYQTHEQDTQRERIDTETLRALVELELTDTAPRPRIIAGGEAHSSRRPRPSAPEPIAPVDRRKPLFTDDTGVDLPRLSTAATSDRAVERIIDLRSDTAALLAAADGAGRRGTSRRQTKRSRFKRLPSLPVVIGAAALAVSAAGVVHTTHNDTVTAADGRLSGASALTGSSNTASVGSAGADLSNRSVPLSRDSGRSADAAARERAQALDKLDAQAEGQDKYLHSNVWVLPISAGVYHLTGRFGDVSGLWATVHTGLDFAAPYGTPIHAIARGTVTYVGYDGAYGNKTVVTLTDGTEIWYCHQNEFAVSVGDYVDQNEVIGYVGATGNTTGPHVHIEVRPGGGDPVDPDPAFIEHGVNPDANQ